MSIKFCRGFIGTAAYRAWYGWRSAAEDVACLLFQHHVAVSDLGANGICSFWDRLAVHPSLSYRPWMK